MRNDMQRRLAAEAFGTFWLVFGGCGSAVLAAGFPALGIGFLGVSFAFGLTVLSMAYAVGHISGGHFNPAVTLGLWSAGRCANKHVLPYIVVQVLGAVLASAVLYAIASGKPDWPMGGFASNGYGDLSPGKYSMMACFIAEFVLTFFFLMIIIGTTSKGAATGFAGIPIGLALTLIHLISIPVTPCARRSTRRVDGSGASTSWCPTPGRRGRARSPRSRRPCSGAASSSTSLRTSTSRSTPCE